MRPLRSAGCRLHGLAASLCDCVARVFVRFMRTTVNVSHSLSTSLLPIAMKLVSVMAVKELR